MPLNLTAVIALKLLPVIVTVVPTAPLAGVNEVIDGAGNTVNEVALVAVPAGLVTVIVPVVVPLATTAVIEVLLTIAKEEALIPFTRTCVAELKLLPVMVIVVPMVPDEGLKDVIVGGRITVTIAVLVPVPKPLVALTTPVVAPDGTVVAIVVSLTIVNAV